MEGKGYPVHLIKTIQSIYRNRKFASNRGLRMDGRTASSNEGGEAHRQETDWGAEPRNSVMAQMRRPCVVTLKTDYRYLRTDLII